MLASDSTKHKIQSYFKMRGVTNCVNHNKSIFYSTSASLMKGIFHAVGLHQPLLPSLFHQKSKLTAVRIIHPGKSFQFSGGSYCEEQMDRR